MGATDGLGSRLSAAALVLVAGTLVARRARDRVLVPARTRGRRPHAAVARRRRTGPPPCLSRGPHRRIGRSFDWFLFGLVASIAVVVPLALIARRRLGVTDDAEQDATDLTESVVRAVGESIDQIERDPDARRAIIRAYAQMEHAFDDAGCPGVPPRPRSSISAARSGRAGRALRPPGVSRRCSSGRVSASTPSMRRPRTTRSARCARSNARCRRRVVSRGPSRTAAAPRSRQGWAWRCWSRPAAGAHGRDLSLRGGGAGARGRPARRRCRAPGAEPAPLERPPRPQRRRAARIDRPALDLAEASAFDLHHALRPIVREIAAARLARRGISLDRQPDRAQALLGAQAWELVRPDREAPSPGPVAVVAAGTSCGRSSARWRRSSGDHRPEVESRSAEILDEVERAVIGKRPQLELVLIGLLADGHVLIEDFPGLAKTLIARSLARVARLSFSRIQFTPDLMPVRRHRLADLRPARRRLPLPARARSSRTCSSPTRSTGPRRRRRRRCSRPCRSTR